MSVLLETSKGDLVCDLYFQECPKTCFNFLRLCQLKRLNEARFTSVQKDYLTQITPSLDQSVFETPTFADEPTKRKFKKKGILAMAN